MKKYIINIITDYSKNIIGGGASSKAPADILHLARKAGFEELVIYNKFPRNRILGYLSIIYQAMLLSMRFKEKSIILFQYPFINVRLIPMVLRFFQKHQLVGLIHDMNSVRENGKLSFSEQKALSYFSELYVHTNNMKDFLSTVLPQSIMYKVLGCFPYIADKNVEERCLSKKVCFAGNLTKSKFLPQFVQKNKNLKILLYGSIKEPNVFGNRAEYKGTFLPDKIQHIIGSWGLVWDGESVDCCGGLYGNYLKIIAPHKFSMYLAADMPVIVWKESAMAALVEKYELGIVVNSLSEISQKIDSVKSEDYLKIVNNIRNFVDDKMNVIF